jgi:hypothetical protein
LSDREVAGERILHLVHTPFELQRVLASSIVFSQGVGLAWRRRNADVDDDDGAKWPMVEHLNLVNQKELSLTTLAKRRDVLTRSAALRSRVAHYAKMSARRKTCLHVTLLT